MSRLETLLVFVLSLFYVPSVVAESGDCLVVAATVPEKAPSFTLISSGQPACNAIRIDGDTFVCLEQDSVARCSTSYIIDIYICADGSYEIEDVKLASGVRVGYVGGGLRFYIDYAGYQEVGTIASWVVHPKAPNVRGTVTLSVACV